MNIHRAQEIAASPVMENVTCEGERVYIQHVDADGGTARIYPLGRPDEEFEVPLRSLSEPSDGMGMEGAQMICDVPEGT
ncbi:H-type small acid-soluble spore protein [Cohnella sp. GCM10027633]|uniref:H-type small acid-soluble spore protein n=1 Tax=unclassified Cohnella TaxID=2636738 RepID=UPI00363BACAD